MIECLEVEEEDTQQLARSPSTDLGRPSRAGHLTRSTTLIELQRAKRVMRAWDADTDGQLTRAELVNGVQKKLNFSSEGKVDHVLRTAQHQGRSLSSFLPEEGFRISKRNNTHSRSKVVDGGLTALAVAYILLQVVAACAAVAAVGGAIYILAEIG